MRDHIEFVILERVGAFANDPVTIPSELDNQQQYIAYSQKDISRTFVTSPRRRAAVTVTSVVAYDCET